MNPTDKERIIHILDAIELIQDWRITRSHDEMYQSAVFRQLEIIGEAARHLSDEFKASFTEVPWRQVTGFRNFIVHHYWDTDWSEIEQTVANDIPEVKRVLMFTLQQANSETGTNTSENTSEQA